VDQTRRTDGGLTYRNFFIHGWYIGVNYSFLTNTEQKLDLRNNLRAGLGKYIIRTNSTYLGAEAGISYVNEIFSSDDETRNSLEAYIGAELNLFDTGDLSLLTKGTAYPGITEKGRFRADYSIDVKYDLPLDFYIKLGYQMNYDNQVVEGASDLDFVFKTGIGWEL
jgi:hypothetical protein